MNALRLLSLSREENFAPGAHTASTQILTLTLNPKPVETDFRP